MSDTLVTLHGWVGGDVTFRTFDDVNVATFRVASTPRFKKQGRWEDGETTWYSVSAWRGLADNVRDSVHRGEAVIVHGRLRTRTYTPGAGEEPRSLLQVDAVLVGHDLTRGTSAFLKKQRSDAPEVDLDAEVAEMVAADLGSETAMDSWGNPRRAADPTAGEQRPEEVVSAS